MAHGWRIPGPLPKEISLIINHLSTNKRNHSRWLPLPRMASGNLWPHPGCLGEMAGAQARLPSLLPLPKKRHPGGKNRLYYSGVYPATCTLVSVEATAPPREGYRDVHLGWRGYVFARPRCFNSKDASLSSAHQRIPPPFGAGLKGQNPVNLGCSTLPLRHQILKIETMIMRWW